MKSDSATDPQTGDFRVVITKVALPTPYLINVERYDAEISGWDKIAQVASMGIDDARTVGTDLLADFRAGEFEREIIE